MDSEKKNTDGDYFREAMADVKPLRVPDRVEPVAKKTPARALQQKLDDQAVISELMDYSDLSPEFETGEELLFLRSGYQKRVLTRLRRGYYSSSGSIDLHHMNVETARKVLIEFLDGALDNGLSCVRVIHGKGLRSKNLPLIKIMTNKILRKHPRVVGFASCRPVDGGTGATDVLLSARKGKAR